MAEKKRIETTLTYEKTTKNTFRYKESPEHPPTVNYIYVQKWIFGANPPRKIRVVIEPLD